jgi:hypothetical protein
LLLSIHPPAQGNRKLALARTLAAALLLIPLCAQALLGDGVPQLPSPLPFPLVFLALMGML